MNDHIIMTVEQLTTNWSKIRDHHTVRYYLVDTLVILVTTWSNDNYNIHDIRLALWIYNLISIVLFLVSFGDMLPISLIYLRTKFPKVMMSIGSY